MALADARRDHLVEAHLPLIKTIARRVWRELGGRFEIEDLEGHGWEGLLQAAERYDSDRGVSFSAFTGHRIRGAMYDAARALGPYSRRQVAAYRRSARPPAAPLPDVETLPSATPGADELAVARERRRRVREAIDRLPPRERQVISKMYLEGRRLVAAGAELGMSKSWASRLHDRAVRRLQRLVDE